MGLTPDSPLTLTDGLDRWPVVEGIPWLRTGREELRAEAVAACDLGDERAALRLLLSDQDDWSPSPPPSPGDVEAAVEGVGAGELALGDAMDLLSFGPVADYFRFRSGDPTYLSGLALLGSAWPGGAPRAFELGCGIGHYLRDLSAIGVPVTGVDVVFAKLWLARRFVVPGAELVCLDASSTLPWPARSFDLAFCHDAFYFLADKAHTAAELRRVVGELGTVAVGHAHNALVDNLSAGDPLTPAGYASLLPGCRLFDDADLTEAHLRGEQAPVRDVDELAAAGAVALVAGPPGQPRCDVGSPSPGARLRLNPLYAEPPAGVDPVPLRVVWPSPRYEAEYASDCGHLFVEPLPRAVIDGAVAGASDEVDALARRRVLVEARP